jgi:hypothetical protein
MTDRIAITAQERIREASSLAAALKFLTANVATAPTNARYRVDDPDSGCEKVAWTAISPAATANVVIPASANECNSCQPMERRELIVQADYGLSGQYTGSYVYEIENLGAIH